MDPTDDIFGDEETGVCQYRYAVVHLARSRMENELRFFKGLFIGILLSIPLWAIIIFTSYNTRVRDCPLMVVVGNGASQAQQLPEHSVPYLVEIVLQVGFESF